MCAAAQGGIDHYAVPGGIPVGEGHGGARSPRCARPRGPHAPHARNYDRILPQIQEDEPTAFVTYEKFERKMLDVLRNSEYSPDSSDMMLQAFRVLDTEKKGYITAERMEELLSTKGTPFREKEMESASRPPPPGLAAAGVTRVICLSVRFPWQTFCPWPRTWRRAASTMRTTSPSSPRTHDVGQDPSSHLVYTRRHREAHAPPR